MTRTVGIGVSGTGWMGEVHSRSYRAVPDRFHESGIVPRLIVCTDAVEARAQAAQQRFGFERYTTDWRTVIADPEVEAISVTAPNGMHLEINRAAAAVGLGRPAATGRAHGEAGGRHRVRARGAGRRPAV